MNIPKVEVSRDTTKIKKQIEALKLLLEVDTNEKDFMIHKEALRVLQEELKSREAKA